MTSLFFCEITNHQFIRSGLKARGKLLQGGRVATFVAGDTTMIRAIVGGDAHAFYRRHLVGARDPIPLCTLGVEEEIC